MKNKILKGILYYGSLVLAITIIQFTIKVGMEGMWLIGIPKPEDVTSVTIDYRYLMDEYTKEITDRDEIETCVHLSGFLKYKPFANTEITTGPEVPVITFYYHLDNGEQVEVTGTDYIVTYKGKRHILKDDNSFVKFVEVLFFQENFGE